MQCYSNLFGVDMYEFLLPESLVDIDLISVVRQKQYIDFKLSSELEDWFKTNNIVYQYYSNPIFEDMELFDLGVVIDINSLSLNSLLSVESYFLHMCSKPKVTFTKNSDAVLFKLTWL
jgi:hypothetical protein